MRFHQRKKKEPFYFTVKAVVLHAMEGLTSVIFNFILLDCQNLSMQASWVADHYVPNFDLCDLDLWPGMTG